MQTNQKGFIAPLVVIIIAFFVIGGGVSYYLKTKHETSAVINNEAVTSTTDKENSTKTITQPDPTANWRSYTSTKAGLSFKYPPEWGDVIEKYQDSAELQTKSELSPKGRQLYLSFSNDIYVQPNPNYVSSKYLDTSKSKYPWISLYSNDTAFWESGPYYKGGPLEEQLRVYTDNNWVTSKPAYFDLAGKYPSIKFTSTREQGYGDNFKKDVIKVFTQTNGLFNGIEIDQRLTGSGQMDMGEKISQEELNFIKNFEDRTLDIQTQNKVDEFNLFVSTFKSI